MARSAARVRLKDFLEKTPIGGEYTFEMPGTPIQAEAFVQNMRVVLSKIRKRYKLAKRAHNPFKVTIVTIIEIDMKINENELEKIIPGCKVTICREKPKNLDHVFADIPL